jgi:hypothetical protein
MTDTNTGILARIGRGKRRRHVLPGEPERRPERMDYCGCPVKLGKLVVQEQDGSAIILNGPNCDFRLLFPDDVVVSFRYEFALNKQDGFVYDWHAVTPRLDPKWLGGNLPNVRAVLWWGRNQSTRSALCAPLTGENAPKDLSANWKIDPNAPLSLANKTGDMLGHVRAAVAQTLYKLRPHSFVHIPALCVRQNSMGFPVVLGGPRHHFTLRLACRRQVRCEYKAAWTSNGLFEFHLVDPRLDAHWLNAQLPTSQVVWKSCRTPRVYRDIDQMRLFAGR